MCESLPAARTAARPLTRCAILLRPSGPWYTAYMAAILASSACARPTPFLYQKGLSKIRVRVTMPSLGNYNEQQGVLMRSSTRHNLSHRACLFPPVQSIKRSNSALQ